MNGRRVLGIAGAIAVAVVAFTLFQMLRAPDGESDASRHLRAPATSARRAGGDASGRSGVATESARDAGNVHARREGLTPDVSADRGAEAREPAAALLKIVVTDRVGGGRLAGVVVTPDASDFTPRELAAIRTRNGLAADAKVELTTDAEGAAPLHWIPGRSLLLFFRPGNRNEDEQTQGVERLKVDEVRELAVALFPGPDLAFYGRVVASGDTEARPVAGAQVLFHDWRVKSTPVAATSTDGRFQFTARSWRNGCVEVAAEGFAPAFARVEPGHETVERALVLQLSKPARLLARVVDASGSALRGATIRLGTAPSKLTQPRPIPIDAPRIERNATTDDAGRATLDDLPPDVALDLELHAAGCAPIEEYEALHLDAGATVEREFKLGSVARVRGRVVAANGDAVESALVRMTPQVRPGEDPRRHLDDRRIRRAARSTGADGRFEISDVPSGTWWLDLDPDDLGRASGELKLVPSAVKVRGEKHRAAAKLVAVDVPSFTRDVEATLIVTLDLSIRGHVRPSESDDRELYGVNILGRPVGEPWLDVVSTVPKSDGTFELAPLVDGEWEVMVNLDDDTLGYGEPPPRRVKAGATEVDFVLEKSAVRILGRVIDATTLQPVDGAWCSVTSTEGGEAARASRDDGRFELVFPTGGTFTVRVTTRDGRFGLVTNVVVTPGGRSDALEIALSPGAKLKLKAPDPPTGCRYEVRRDGVLVASDEFGLSREIERTVPAGRLEIRLFRGDEPLTTRDVEAKSGETVSCGE